MNEFDDILLSDEDKSKIMKVLQFLMDCVIFTQQMHDLPTCNDCAKQDNCEYVPDWGERVRYNCPHWKGYDKNEQANDS